MFLHIWQKYIKLLIWKVPRIRIQCGYGENSALGSSMCISSNLDSFLFFTHFHCLPGWLAGWEISTCRSVFAIDPVNILGIDMDCRHGKVPELRAALKEKTEARVPPPLRTVDAHPSVLCLISHSDTCIERLWLYLSSESPLACSCSCWIFSLSTRSGRLDFPAFNTDVELCQVRDLSLLDYDRVDREELFEKAYDPSKQKFPCPHPGCNKKFQWKKSMKRHERIHTGNKPFQCAVCQKKFTYRHHLLRHGVVHTGEKPFQCEVCGNRFTQPASLKLHERIHTGEKPFHCSVCQKKFTTRMHLLRHGSYIQQLPFEALGKPNFRRLWLHW